MIESLTASGKRKVDRARPPCKVEAAKSAVFVVLSLSKLHSGRGIRSLIKG